MFGKLVKQIAYFLQTALTKAFLSFLKFFPFETRVRIGSSVLGFLVFWIKPSRRRIENNLRHVYPDMEKPERNIIIRAVGKSAGASIIELLNNDDFTKQSHLFHASGPGLQVLHDAREQGTGAFLISGHFGSWEAGRQYLKSTGNEVAALYRPNSNPYYEKLHLKQLENGGKPIFPKGRRGTMSMVRHLQNGGIVGILHDQYQSTGEPLDFLGQDAKTSLAIARIALKYNIPMIPLYGTRRKNGPEIDITFEAPIPQTDAKAMMQVANDSLAAKVQENPEQWYWLHKRWK